jgi:cation diffusion facilitator family transporter
MNEPYAADNSYSNLAETRKLEEKAHLINEGLNAGRKIAKISIITLISIGIAELTAGQISGSVVATADGVDSLSDAVISFIVLLGLRLANRPADKKFHFGYYKVEIFAALMAAIGMTIVGSFILYHSYQMLLHPFKIQQPIVTMIVLAAAAGISLQRALQMRKIANKYDLVSLKIDAKNSIKDGSASVIGFVSVLVATHFGFLQADAMGGIIIAGYIFSVSYISLREASLILIDAWQNPRAIVLIRNILEEKFKEDQIKVTSVLIRPAGMVAHAEIHIETDRETRLFEVDLLSMEMQRLIRSRIPTMTRITVVPHPSRGEEPETVKEMNPHMDHVPLFGSVLQKDHDL